MVTLHGQHNSANPDNMTSIRSIIERAVAQTRTAALIEAAGIMCEWCAYSLPMANEYEHDGSRLEKGNIDCEAWKIRGVLSAEATEAAGQ